MYSFLGIRRALSNAYLGVQRAKTHAEVDCVEGKHKRCRRYGVPQKEFPHLILMFQCLPPDIVRGTPGESSRSSIELAMRARGDGRHTVIESIVMPITVVVD